ncbi:hypothetical protein KO506_11335 [Polaribacter vadi]|uniref:hypothetical protein n=1 Tax=Polaribacter TaxID=52959 RepID=UPI001C0810D4|nr:MULTISPECIES: hypothetical protein [Polaribacter]MBU3011997.1 hypothetical protein [Polaribacter vadi]MDO6741812.1 hypothetical protein [Polaribacter sp. 1_MG-2023]
MQTFFKSGFKRALFFISLGVLIFILSYKNGMFWDNVLFASKMGNHLYENSIFNWNIPIGFDPGHPPFLGFLLAIFWRIFGHQLWVSHLLIIPFTIGFFFQISKFISYFIKDTKKHFYLFILIIAEPTLATTFVIVNPEIIILFFFFLVINSILYKNIFLKVIGLLFLSIISYRSMLLVAGIFLFEILNNLYLEKKKINSILNFKFLAIYFLGSLSGISFVIWRLITKGWLQTHPESPWSSLWKYVDFKGFLKNCFFFVHRYSDFGRIFIFMFLIISFFLFGKKIIKHIENKQLLLLAISSVFFIILVSLISTNTFGHRYFIASYILFIVFSFKILNDHYIKKKIIYSLLFIGLITGNLWIYPKEISQGWDASLAHIPYHSLRLKTIDYLNQEKINIEEVASFFPNYNTLDYIDFKGDKRSFQKFNGKNKYVFYATVFNLSDDELKSLKNDYIILKEFNNFNIATNIYILKEQ